MDKQASRASFGGPADYYDLPPNLETVMDLIDALNMGYARGNILKSVIRWGCKGPPSDLEYDLEKIRYFAAHLLRRLRTARARGEMGENLQEEESDVSGLDAFEAGCEYRKTLDMSGLPRKETE